VIFDIYPSRKKIFEGGGIGLTCPWVGTQSVYRIVSRVLESMRKLTPPVGALIRWGLENCFRGMNTRAARCLNAGRDVIMETNYEEAQYPWDRRWSGVIDCGACLAAMVARKECGGIP
jgi:hypothetical protein